ncbi:DUF4386 family protein [Nocardioides sp. SR21]|uniref:DUF4386 family protein n=1 Tax=Nocardioides sp. SR21 TaxID=2919501 RepID=UPI001FA97C27|nr:hypothetical protein [Nocardioides sp. SR21]
MNRTTQENTVNEIQLGAGVLDPQLTRTTVVPDPVPLRRRLLAIASVVSPLALAAQYALDPTGLLPRDDATVLLEAIAEDPGQYVAATVVYLVAMVTMLAWALTLYAALRDRAPRLAATAATMLSVAAVGGGGFAGLRLVAASFVEDGQVVPGAQHIWSQLQEGPVFVVLGPMMLMAITGTLVAGIAMVVARRDVTVWAAPLYLAGFVLGSGEFAVGVSVVGGVLQAGAVLLIARQAVRR